ncbi:4'-phosphopantetheinyl transferase family protein [Dongshaea marina]|uniref:4'-phosphopantetheinyl transferase family protein n=1 Tax=Dongshaea marina TaxID=2047966 RepID=UPI000D3E8B19|nr:4'-phosphopantetheinyl transferase superfamily protein [Dongshaea marina]
MADIYLINSQDLDPGALNADNSWLSTKELQTQHALTNPKRRHEYLVSRLLLRQLLAKRCNCHPSDLRFIHNPYGRPQLADSSLSFNLSHSGDTLVLAIADEGQVGVDIECKPRPRDPLNIARRFFCESEQRMLEQLSLQQRTQSFYQLWTLKEALLKSHGQGLNAGLNKVELSLSTPLKLTNYLDKHQYHLALWQLDTGYLAACQRDSLPQWQLHKITADLKCQPVALPLLTQS